MKNTLPPSLTSEQNNALIREYQQTHSEEIKNKLVVGNAKLVFHFVNQFGSSFENCICYGYPSLEDLEQIALAEILNCIEKFDPDQNTAFSSYLSKAVKNRFLMLIRSNKHAKKDLHYNDPILTEKGKDPVEPIELIVDERLPPTNFEDKAELSFIKKQILPYLPIREGFVFRKYFLEHLTQKEISKLTNINRANVSKILKNAVGIFKDYYFHGVSKLARRMQGVVLNTPALSILKNAEYIVDRHGKEFLRDAFLPSLCRHKALVFRHSVLFYNGQSLGELAQETGLSIKELKVDYVQLDSTLSQLDHSHQKNPDAEKIKGIENLISSYGGSIFLTKYFLPTLPPQERQAFIYGILQFTGRITSQTASYAGQTLSEFKNNLQRSIAKLRSKSYEQMVLDIIKIPSQDQEN